MVFFPCSTTAHCLSKIPSDNVPENSSKESDKLSCSYFFLSVIDPFQKELSHVLLIVLLLYLTDVKFDER